MKYLKEIPFFENASDGMHCFQASLKMIMKYFWPDENYSWDELDKITSKAPGLWTWQMAGLIWLQEKGLEIKAIEVFDYKKFAELGGQYLLDEFGEEVGKAQIEHSDISQELEFAKKFSEVIDIEKRIPTIEDVKKLLQDDYVIVVNVNSRVLRKTDGYSGHFIVVKGFDEDGFILNDPGLPGIENMKAGFELFEKAWAYPNEKAKNIMAFRK
jgi:hypothetical protein